MLSHLYYTQFLENNILFKEDFDILPDAVMEKTIMFFDATGGRLLDESEYSWTEPKTKYNDLFYRKGYNSNPINTFNGKLCIAIGDSLYQGNFLEGNSVTISFCVSFIMTIVLSNRLSNMLYKSGNPVIQCNKKQNTRRRCRKKIIKNRFKRLSKKYKSVNSLIV